MLPLPSSGQCHYTVAFSPCGRWLAAGGGERAVDVWDLSAPQNLARRLQDAHEPIVRVGFASDGTLVVVSVCRVQTFEAGALSFVRTRFLGHANRAAVAPDGLTVFTTDGALHRRSVDGSTARPDWTRGDLRGTVTDVAVTGNGRVLAARDNSDLGLFVSVYDEGGANVDDVAVTGRPHRVACSADGRLAATLANGNLSVWNLAARTAVVDRIARAHGGWLSVAFDPHGRRIATGGIDSTVAVWAAASAGPPLTTFQWGVGPVYVVAFDRDGLRAAAAGHSGAIVWDMDE